MSLPARDQVLSLLFCAFCSNYISNVDNLSRDIHLAMTQYTYMVIDRQVTVKACIANMMLDKIPTNIISRTDAFDQCSYVYIPVELGQ